MVNTSYNIHNNCILLYFNLIVSMLLTCVYIAGTYVQFKAGTYLTSYKGH